MCNALEEKHIQCIVEAATSATPSSLCPPLAKIQGLPAALRRWTGGSPRLLVYSLRVLHHLLHEGRAFDNAEKAMQEVYGILKDQQAVASEVFLAEEDEAEWQQTWLYLILLAQLRVPCQRKTFLPVGSAEHSLDLLLGRLNVYISKPEQPIEGMSDAFYISHMKMVEKFVREKYSSDCRVPLFLGGEAAGISAEDLLERMVEQRIIVQACMCQGQRWGDVMKPLLHGTQAETLAVVLDQGCPLDTFPKITSAVTERKTISLPLPANLHPGNLAAAMQRLNSNRLYRPAPKSNSADLFIKQQELIIELQDKSGVTAGVSFFDACQEVAKCIQEGPVLWVLVALKLTDSLLRCVGTKKPLLLTPGVYQEEKSAEGGLLYRPNGKSKKWQKRILHGTWSDLGSSRVEAKDTSRLEVREGLELVIPHPEHVKTFLGDDFEIVKKLAERRKDDAPGGMIKIPFLSRFYNFQKPPAQGTSEERFLVEQFVSASELVCEVLVSSKMPACDVLDCLSAHTNTPEAEACERTRSCCILFRLHM